MNRKDLNKRVRQLVKRANQRLTEIEKRGMSGQSRAYEYVSSELPNRYFLTQVVNKKSTGRAGLKFRTNIGSLKTSEVEQIKTAVESFLSAKTSTIIGIQDVQKKAKKAFKEQFGEETYKQFEKQGFENFMSGEMWKKAYNKWGSDEINTAIATHGYATVESALSQALQDNVDDWKIVEDRIKQLEERYGK